MRARVQDSVERFLGHVVVIITAAVSVFLLGRYINQNQERIHGVEAAVAAVVIAFVLWLWIRKDSKPDPEEDLEPASFVRKGNTD